MTTPTPKPPRFYTLDVGSTIYVIDRLNLHRVISRWHIGPEGRTKTSITLEAKLQARKLNHDLDTEPEID